MHRNRRTAASLGIWSSYRPARAEREEIVWEPQDTSEFRETADRSTKEWFGSEAGNSKSRRAGVQDG